VRFLTKGVDIPEDLIRGVNEGRVTFLCGAGVSRRVGLPSFEILTKHVYTQLGEVWDEEPAEANAIKSREYDRALRSLEKRTRLPKTVSRMRDAVVAKLAAPAGPFPDHSALLQLSRDADGRPRLLTTNFDTIFERAAREAGYPDVPSYAGRSIPRPGGELDHGILHLHGRIPDPDLKMLASDLILTSADFGDAYLRDGWASRYIEDRMRLGILVLVGYAAEDAAMRLLLETLDADRDRFKDLNDIYALERGAVGSGSLWKAKGIRPIEFSDYDDLYDTLREWARYAANPGAYRGDRLVSILGVHHDGR
jgi:hypothetical protein